MAFRNEKSLKCLFTWFQRAILVILGKRDKKSSLETTALRKDRAWSNIGQKKGKMDNSSHFPAQTITRFQESRVWVAGYEAAI